MIRRKIGKHPALAAPYGRVNDMFVKGHYEGRLNLHFDKLNQCNASRKGDREVLAGVLVRIAEKQGAEVERRDTPRNPGYSGAGIDLKFELGGVGAILSIDDLHGGDHALISWFNTQYPSRNFTTRFCVCVGDRGQFKPHHKATSCPADWFSLAMFLEGGLMLAARGEAFEPFDL